MQNVLNNIYPKYQYNVSVDNTVARPSFTGLNKLPKTMDEFVSSKSKQKDISKTAKNVLAKMVNASKKAEPPKLADDLRSLIIDITKKTSEATGKDAVVFSIPNYEALVLRVEKTALEKIDNLGKDLELVPIKYDEAISKNKNLGLPLYFVTEKGSEIAKKGSLTPLEALSQPDKIMVLKKVTGEHPSAQYWEDLTQLMGYDDMHPCIDQLNNFYFLGFVRGNFGNDAAIKCLERCKNGSAEFKLNELGDGSPAFTFVDGEKFYANYRKFADDYIKSLKEISEMPQKSYDDAVKTILSPKDFIMDFQHTNNTFVDLKNSEFNFMDFVFDKSMYSKYYYENPIKEFRNVLMGKCFSSKFKTPRQFMIYPDDIAQVKTFSNAINEKINIASPEKFKSENPFR